LELGTFPRATAQFGALPKPVQQQGNWRFFQRSEGFGPSLTGVTWLEASAGAIANFAKKALVPY
jgi:hypothetical protein